MIAVLDTLQVGRPGIIAATLLETTEGLALFDPGPESTFANVGQAIRQAGADPNDIRHAFLSHIHFDHAGAAWRFAEGGATVYVHPRGAPHLVDPAKLIESATRIFGRDMDRLWGKVAPVPAGRVQVLEDNEVVRLGPMEIRAIATPGHASHHHVFHWDDTVFGGDVAGVRLGTGPPIPPFVPPELHIESWHESIAKIRGLGASHLYLPHFGKVEGSLADHLDALDERVREWSAWLGDKLRAGLSEQQLKTEFANYVHTDLVAGSSSPVTDHAALIDDYETADPSHMAVTAAARYWKKYHPVEG